VVSILTCSSQAIEGSGMMREYRVRIFERLETIVAALPIIRISIAAIVGWELLLARIG